MLIGIVIDDSRNAPNRLRPAACEKKRAFGTIPEGMFRRVEQATNLRFKGGYPVCVPLVDSPGEIHKCFKFYFINRQDRLNM